MVSKDMSDLQPRSPAGTQGQRARQKPRGWWLMTALAAVIASYGLAYAVLGERMFNGPLAASFRARPWGIFLHALFASIALLLGPLQFHRGLLLRWRWVHRNLGKLYVVSAFSGGGLLGLYMAWYSFGGWATHLGFGILAALTATTTAFAYFRIRAGEVKSHREWMIRSYALIFAAVTLRLWLPLLVVAFAGDFLPAYRIVAWLCWVPNLALVEWYIRRSRNRIASALPRLSTAAAEG
jgi:hypothetical protein